MKISGVTIVRNAQLNDYPVVEAIRSILPLVDEMVVSVDPGDDDSEGLVRSIGSTKIRVVHSRWDMSLREGGVVYAVETNKVLDQVDPASDWVFYIQADEVIHEKYHAAIREAALHHKDNPRVEGLLFRYLHFYGTYDYVGDSRKWYRHEVRIVKNDPAIRSYKDAQGFRKNGRKLQVVPVQAEVYHYGWVKSPEQLKRKQKHVLQFYTSDEKRLEDFRSGPDLFNYEDFDALRLFTGQHPAVMQNRIAARNWQVQLDISRKRFTPKGWFLYYFEKLTGIRLFAFSNHRIIRA
ncbi:MAG TPA: glycosyltransferase family 2 protein [Lacibacter sp.]|nr:glycosyltransferase family 2 protein [Lacibacter sp.]HMO87938.1 glycosyltransferase family 2 protein [Lacibacter sp.]HMP86251.1 glycosyltransferase family 2 protein [Lacibacter sp.]